MDAQRNDWIAKIRKSLDRDQGLPLSEKVDKAVRYVAAAATAPVFLRACDRVGARARTRGRPIVENAGRIEIGDDVQLNSTYSPVHLAAAPGGAIALGNGVNVNFGAVIRAEASVTLGDRVSLGPYVRIADQDDEAEGEPLPIEIGDDVWLAARVRVKRGAKIGAGTVVTAGSVVVGELPPNVIAGGSPARVLRPRGGAAVAEARPKPAPPPAAKPDFRGLLVADFSIQELAAHLARKDDLGTTVAATVAPFGQVMQTLLDLPTTGKEQDLDFALVWTRPEQAAPAFAERLRGGAVEIDRLVAEVDAFADLVLRASSGVRHLFVASWTMPPHHRGMGMLDLKSDGVAGLLLRMNARLAERLESTANVFLLDAQRWVARSGRAAVSTKLWYMGKVGFSSDVLAEAAHDLRAALRGAKGQARKLLVLDLDDTMWGGIVGDVGWQNLRLGGHDALGEAFCDFQGHVKALAKRGIALAIVSKNEESVALEAFRSHPEMVLKLEDISAYRINWRDKAMNIVEIVKEMNLGLQSVVFIDDNPVERARVREALPEVFVPEWPEDKMLYAEAFLGLRCFDVPRISKEDLERTKMYAAERQRDEMKTQFASLDEWLESLGITVRFERLSAANLPRTTQLLNKTNQMNLRTRRATEAELMEWASAPGHELWAISVSDKLGDAGLTGIVGLEVEGDRATISDYVLSCRVMGRKVEETLVWAAIERARARGARTVVAPFVATSKNMPCLSFWQRSGFACQEDGTTFTFDVAGDYPRPRAVTATGLEVRHV